MNVTCPRCRTPLPAAARFCGHCGLNVEDAPLLEAEPGRFRDPRACPVPPGFVPAEGAPQLYFRWESALGGRALIGTEGLKVALFNAGYSLVELQLELRGEGRDTAVVFELIRELPALPKGGVAEIDIPAYEVREELRVLRVRLRSAAFDRTARET